MNKHILFYTLIVGLIFSACTSFADDVYSSQFDEEEIREMALHLFEEDSHVEFMDTKSIDSRISDFWVFQFNSSNQHVGMPAYYEMSSFSGAISVVYPIRSNVTYTLVIIANTHDSGFADKIGSLSYKTLGNIQNCMLAYDDFSSLQSIVSDSSDHILMNGTTQVKYNDSSLECTLHRSVARLSINLSNPAESGVEVEALRLVNVPNKFYCYDDYFVGKDNVPSSESVYFLDMFVDNVALDENGEYQKQCYIPRNVRGYNDATTNEGKNVDAPEFATYIELIAKARNTGAPIKYHFYLGRDVNDFNVISNHDYIVNIDMRDVGDAIMDNRIEDYRVMLQDPSNCYMLTQYGSVYSFIPSEKSNPFWKSVHGKAYENAADMLIGPSDRWVAELIWMDTKEPAFCFCDSAGNAYEDGGRMSGLGNGSINVKRIPGTEGNAVIGIRKENADDGCYIWSWHLWMTDYYPDGEKYTAQKGKYTYPVDGGNVFAVVYYSNFSTCDTKSAYYNKMMMDRNVGAMTADCSDESSFYRAIGMYYQYGNKNPRPRVGASLYDYYGGEVEITDFSAKKNMYEVVLEPTVFSKNNKNWLASTQGFHGEWYIPEWDYTSEIDKSYFDPCPAGWRLPVGSFCYSTFAEYRPDSGAYYASMLCDRQEFNKSSGDYFVIPKGGYIQNGVMMQFLSRGACWNVWTGTQLTGYVHDEIATSWSSQSQYNFVCKNSRCIQE